MILVNTYDEINGEPLSSFSFSQREKAISSALLLVYGTSGASFATITEDNALMYLISKYEQRLLH